MIAVQKVECAKKLTLYVMLRLKHMYHSVFNRIC